MSIKRIANLKASSSRPKSNGPLLKKTLASKGPPINVICALCGKFLGGVDGKAHLDTDHSLDPNLIEWIVQFDDRLSKLDRRMPPTVRRHSTLMKGKIGMSESLDRLS
ncbi:MAG: hypothetical protein ACM3JQ_05125 [Candidatus Eiseniibacteriota bacterium]